MTNTTQQVFTNTCGKIFRNRLVLATPKHETLLSYDEIKNISFDKKRKKGDLLVALLPAVLIVISFFLKKEESTIKLLFIILGVVGIALALFKAQARYVVIVKKTDSRSITVRAAGKREAEKFASQANGILQKHRSGALSGTGGIDVNNAMPFASF